MNTQPAHRLRARLVAQQRASAAARYAAAVDMRGEIENLTREAEEQIREGVWEVGAADRVLAGKTASELTAVIHPPDVQQKMAPIDRLEHLREALAALAIALARVHGPMAWFLAAASTALTPVLHWRALPADGGRAFGAIEPTAAQYADAEQAVRRIRDTLARITTA
ncbi:hypothetical protein [Kitasatospora sp. NPDC001547]|uniref:hypothetical protein n=1 Tax=Kitasatospora sp. NPDC001547 TaxID=3364015 RepID=UPI0036BA6CB7